MRQLGEGLWVHEDSMRLGGVELPLRMTVVELANGSLWVHSPTSLSEGLTAELNRLGPVSALLAPSNGHNLFLREWITAYPVASIYCSRGIPKKIPELKDYAVLENESGSPWPDELDMQVLDGVPFFDECIFLHRASRSLIVTDFVQNHRDQEQIGFARVMQKLVLEPVGFKDICLAPPLRFGFMIKDRGAFITAVRKILGWPFDRIVVTHGPIIEDQPRDTLNRLCQRFSV